MNEHILALGAVAVTAWCALSVGAALVIGRMITLRDREPAAALVRVRDR